MFEVLKQIDLLFYEEKSKHLQLSSATSVRLVWFSFSALQQLNREAEQAFKKVIAAQKLLPVFFILFL